MKIEYTKVGDYYLPNLYYPEETRPIGFWGMLRKEYLNPLQLDDSKLAKLNKLRTMAEMPVIIL